MKAVISGPIAAKDPKGKNSCMRLSVLQLAENLESLSKAFRRSGMDRTSLYASKKRFEDQGLEGLMDLSLIHLTHPQTTPKVVEGRVQVL